MVKRSRVSESLSARNQNYNEYSVVSSITNISRLVVDLGTKQLDINPMIVNVTGSLRGRR